jgi:hypothetical protein
MNMPENEKTEFINRIVNLVTYAIQYAKKEKKNRRYC